jgi:hypothetical protein
MTLAGFQDAFARALRAPDDGCGDMARLTAQPGFAIYRNTVMKGCIDALQANYPAVARLVGEEWFRAAAAVFAREHLPARASLLDYGAGFADFLAGFPPAQELPYLPGVARIERFWTEAHLAADAPPLCAASVAPLAPDELAGMRVRPHPSARWAFFADHPVATIWRQNRAPDGTRDGDVIDWRGEGILVVRPAHVVANATLDAAGCAFLDACAAGGTLGEAAIAALDVDPELDLARLMAQLLETGALARPQSDDSPLYGAYEP